MENDAIHQLFIERFKALEEENISLSAQVESLEDTCDRQDIVLNILKKHMKLKYSGSGDYLILQQESLYGWEHSGDIKTVVQFFGLKMETDEEESE